MTCNVSANGLSTRSAGNTWIYVALACAVMTVGCGGEPVSPHSEEMKGAWEATVRATPVLLGQNPEIPTPLPITHAARLVFTDADMMQLNLSGLCPSNPGLMLTLDASSSQADPHYGGPPFICASCLLPAYQPAGAHDSWDLCEGATLEVNTVSFHIREDGTLYGEGGAVIRGCGRTWDTVLFQVYGERTSPGTAP